MLKVELCAIILVLKIVRNQNRGVYMETHMASWGKDYSTCPANDINWDNINFRVLARILYMVKIYV